MNQLVKTVAGPQSRLGLILLCCLMAVLAIFGGSSRMDEPLLLFARFGVIVIGCIAFVNLDRAAFRIIRTPLLFLLAFAVIIAVQLIPLPPSVWQARPGMEELIAISRLAGTLDVWRPLSLDPMATLNSLMSLLVPLAAILCYPLLSDQQRSAFPYILLAVAAFSIAVAGLQVGGANQLYYYRIINKGVATGIMANRNHQAMLLASSIPAIAAVLLNRSRGSLIDSRDLLFAGLTLVVVIGMVVATGSRAGLLLVLVVVGLSGYVLWPAFARSAGRNGGPEGSRWRNVLAGTGLAAVFVLIIAAMGGGMNSFSRLGEVEVGGDQRVEVIPQLIELVQKFFPFGSGFGSFPWVFQIIEPDNQLNTAYFNNAHNDFAQIIIEGGVLGAALVVFALFIGAKGMWRLIAAPRNGSRGVSGRDRSLILVGVGLFLATAIASLFDYPLRTPVVAGLAALAGCILCDWRLNAGSARHDVAR